jgi:Mrp family chromosome partitioning ATPase
LTRPAVISITSSTPNDGKEVAARELAASLAAAGYSTLLLDTSVPTTSGARRSKSGTLEAEVRKVAADRLAGTSNALNFCDVVMQETTSQRDIQAALSLLRSSYDYTIVVADCEISTSFAMSMVAASDGVLVTVRMGRRRKSSDARVSTFLNDIGIRFLGVVALEPAIIKQGSVATLSDSATASNNDRLPLRNRTVLEDDDQRREIAQSPAF